MCQRAEGSLPKWEQDSRMGLGELAPNYFYKTKIFNG